MTGKDARSIDKKIDDGEPDSGMFFVAKGYDGGYQSGCVDQDPNASASVDVSYDLSDNTESCHPIFFLGF